MGSRGRDMRAARRAAQFAKFRITELNLVPLVDTFVSIVFFALTTATVGELQVSFEIDDYTRWRLLEGLDDIGLTLRNEDKIAQFEARREAWRPRTLPVP